MEALLKQYLPNAPNLGLYIAPDLPEKLVRNAVRDYARSVDEDEVFALYDATLMGSAKDGAVFTADRLVYQNNDLQKPQTVRYDDIVNLSTKRKLLGGREIRIDANSGSATVTHTLDFSGKPDAAEFVARFLKEAMLASAGRLAEPEGETDVEAVARALQDLMDQGKLTAADYQALMDVLDRS